MQLSVNTNSAKFKQNEKFTNARFLFNWLSLKNKECIYYMEVSDWGRLPWW